MRPEKNLIISEIKTRVDRSPYVLLTDYTGMQVPQFNELRNRLSGANAEYRVVKKQPPPPRAPGIGSPRSRELPARTIRRRHRRYGCQRRREGHQELHRRVSRSPSSRSAFSTRPWSRGPDHGAGRPAVRRTCSKPSSSACSSRRPRNWFAWLNTPASQIAQVLKAHSDKGEKNRGRKNRCITLSVRWECGMLQGCRFRTGPSKGKKENKPWPT